MNQQKKHKIVLKGIAKSTFNNNILTFTDGNMLSALAGKESSQVTNKKKYIILFSVLIVPLLSFLLNPSDFNLMIVLSLFILSTIGIFVFSKGSKTLVNINLSMKTIDIKKESRKSTFTYNTSYTDELKIKVKKKGFIDMWVVMLDLEKDHILLQIGLGVAQSENQLKEILSPYKEKIEIAA